MYDSRPKLKRQFRYFDIFKGPFINHVDSEGGEGMLEAGLRGQNFLQIQGVRKRDGFFESAPVAKLLNILTGRDAF